MTIQKSYSLECLSIFNIDDINNKNIANILFDDDENQKKIFIDSITKSINCDDLDKKNKFLDILPIEYIINKRDIQIKYIVLENDTFMLVLTDITDVRKAKKELNIFKDNMIAIFTHELKTPLNAIINFSQYIASSLNRKLNSKKIDKLTMLSKKITSNGFTQLNMIETLLEVARIQSKNVTPNKEKINLSKFIIPRIEAYKDAFNRTVTYDIDKTDMIKVDKRLCAMVFDNLYSNALKYSKSRVHISFKKIDGYGHLSIEDDGIGIIDSEKENIFGLFEQAEIDVRQNNTKSTGIGLYTVRILADICDKNILIENSMNLGGAKFIIQGRSKTDD